MPAETLKLIVEGSMMLIVLAVGLECSLDGVGDKLRGLRVDGDVAAEQHAADDLPGVPGRILRAGGHCQPSLLR